MKMSQFMRKSAILPDIVEHQNSIFIFAIIFFTSLYYTLTHDFASHFFNRSWGNCARWIRLVTVWNKLEWEDSKHEGRQDHSEVWLFLHIFHRHEIIPEWILIDPKNPLELPTWKFQGLLWIYLDPFWTIFHQLGFLKPIHGQACGQRGRDNFPQGKIFKEFLGGWKTFPTHFLVNFDVFLVDFDAKTQTGGENMPKIQNGGRKKEGGKTPELGGTNFPEFFWGGKTHFSPLSLTLVHVCSYIPLSEKVDRAAATEKSKFLTLDNTKHEHNLLIPMWHFFQMTFLPV